MRYILLFLSVFFVFTIPVFSLEIKSTAFEDGGSIPVKYTCDSLDVSPALSWSDIPKDTKSFALICDDPDAPVGIWVHWVIFNIPKEVTELKENTPKTAKLADGTTQGRNDFRRTGYGGPCPPPGKPHRYFFKLYALDTMLPLDETAGSSDITKAMQGHILAEAKIFGFYKR